METDVQGSPLAYYVYGLGLISREDAKARRAFITTTRGSTVALTNLNGEFTDTYK